MFNDRQIRTAWDDKEEKWYFSIVDVVAVLTDSIDYQTARKYWKVLKGRLLQEGDELVTNCYQLKLRAADGKMRLTDVADQQQLFRLIQSIPSPKAEPFKIWMAQVASERVDEIQDPELAIDRGIEYYRHKGYSEGWINERMKGMKPLQNVTRSKCGLQTARCGLRMWLIRCSSSVSSSPFRRRRRSRSRNGWLRWHRSVWMRFRIRRRRSTGVLNIIGGRAIAFAVF